MSCKNNTHFCLELTFTEGDQSNLQITTQKSLLTRKIYNGCHRAIMTIQHTVRVLG